MVGVGQRRQRGGDPVEHRRAPLLGPLDLVPVGDHRVRIGGGDVAEHVGVTADELVVDPAGDVGDREPPGLLGDRGVELDLVQQIAELLDEGVLGGGVVGIERGEGVDELERLLDEVRHEAGVVLLAVPRAPLAQGAGELVEADVPGADRRGEVRHVDARQVVGLDGAVELAPRRLGDPLLGRPESLQDHHPLVAVGLLGGELDVRQDPAGVGVGDQQRSGRPGRGGGEVVTVDQPDTGLDRVDAEARPGQVEERHRREHVDVHPAVGAQQLDRTLQHERRAGDRVQDLAVLGRRGHERVDDLRVDVVVPRRRLVEVVEAGRRGDEVGARVDRRAQVAVRDAGDRGAGRVGHVLVVARAEPDDRDVHARPTTWPLSASQRP